MNIGDNTHAPKRRKTATNGEFAPVQTVYDEFTSSDSDSDDSDAFEDVDLGLDQSTDLSAGEADSNSSAPLQITLSSPIASEQAPTKAARKAPLSKEEKRLRLHVHKAHVRCLFYHVWTRNAWCNVDGVKKELRKLVPAKTRRLFDFDKEKSRAECNHAWHAGMEEVVRMWKASFRITERGMRRAFWAESHADLEKKMSAYSTEPELSFEDFVQAAITREGSRDTGAQLFCALLRSLDLDTRLVCSLQPLPFSGEAKAVKPPKPQPTYAKIVPSSNPPRNIPRPPSPEPTRTAYNSPLRRLGLRTPAPRTSPSRATPPPPRPSPRARARAQAPQITDSAHPIFWTEVFSLPLNRWLPIDPLVHATINKPRTGFEPPLSDPLNALSYAVAFEADFSAHDVTRRYVRHFNAKTRKTRVEATPGGEEWMRCMLGAYGRPMPLERYLRRDADEEGELAEREEREEMPAGVEDFRAHPKYALERHLRRQEAIRPAAKRVALFSPGSRKPSESVYRRADVVVVRSAEQWFRVGREVKRGEQPVKRVVPKKLRSQPQPSKPDDNSDEPEEEAGLGTATETRLYSHPQTQPYLAPPVVNNHVPTNPFGNLEIFTPNMVPAGAVHIPHPDALLAAKILGISYAPAVTGFSFQRGSGGRRGKGKGTAVIEGVVVVAECVEGVEAVREGLEALRGEMERERRERVVLGMWRVMLRGLRIRERVREYESESESGEEEEEGKGDGDGEEKGDWRDRRDEEEREEEKEEGREHEFGAGAHGVGTGTVEVNKKEDGKSETENETENENEKGQQPAKEEEEEEEEDYGGGFLAEGEEEDHDDEDDDNEDEDDSSGGGGFLAESEEEDDDFGGGGFMPD